MWIVFYSFIILHDDFFTTILQKHTILAKWLQKLYNILQVSMHIAYIKLLNFAGFVLQHTKVADKSSLMKWLKFGMWTN